MIHGNIFKMSISKSIPHKWGATADFGPRIFTFGF